MNESAWKSNDKMDEACTLVIPSQFSALREMSAWLEGKLRHLDMPEVLIFNVDVCANEAVTNIVSYAYPEDGDHQIALRLWLQENALSLQIEDDGMPFNPLARPQHAQPASLEEAEIGGLGIDLIRSLMDECHYARMHDRNILTMVAFVDGRTARDG